MSGEVKVIISFATEDFITPEQTFTREGSYPEGLTGANICRYCRLQSWSVKPAVRSGRGSSC